MKPRFAYPILFLLPSAMIAFLSAILAAGGGAGVLWLFVYGDSPWPEAAGTILMVVAGATGIASFGAMLFSSYAFGRRREPAGGVSRRHVALAVAVSILLPVLVLLHQWQVGNLGAS